MRFFHKLYYNPNYINPNKKSPSDICPKPKKVYKLYNVKQFFFKHREKKLYKILKLLNYKDLIEKKFNLKKQPNIFCKKPNIYIYMFFTFV